MDPSCSGQKTGVTKKSDEKTDKSKASSEKTEAHDTDKKAASNPSSEAAISKLTAKAPQTKSVMLQREPREKAEQKEVAPSSTVEVNE